VRPEDIQRYQEIDIDSVKIAGRTAKQSTLSALAQLYLEQSFPGDIGVLVDRRTVWTRIQKRLPEGTPAFKIRVDNDALSELTHYFLNKGCLGQCHRCGMCKKLADRIIEYDPTLHSLYLAELKKMLAEQFNHHRLANS
jgi:collagenase-like PrtC family protease